jgi:hypothetical protein
MVIWGMAHIKQIESDIDISDHPELGSRASKPTKLILEMVRNFRGCYMSG